MKVPFCTVFFSTPFSFSCQYLHTEASSSNFAEVVNSLLKNKIWKQQTSGQGKETYFVMNHKSITSYFVSQK